MPSLIETTDTVLRDISTDLSFEKTHCVHIRHANSTCTRCIEVCLSGAITAQDNHLTIDATACENCGACSNVCPTEALKNLHPTTGQTAQNIALFAQELPKSSPLYISCACACDTDEFVATHSLCVPCMAFFDEALLLFAASCGFTQINYLTGSCKTCPNTKAFAVFEQAKQSVQTLIDIWSVPVSIEPIEQLPADAPATPQQTEEVSRRSFFGNLASGASSLAVDVMSTQQEAEHPQSLREMLMSTRGGLVYIEPERINHLLNRLYEYCDTTATHNPNWDKKHFTCNRFARVEISHDCISCGMCARFCPTQALKHIGDERPANPMLGRTASKGPNHEFRASDCVACGLCQDVCPTHALTINHTLTPAELLDFEPREIKRT